MKRIIIIWALLISVAFGQSKPGFYVVAGKVITVQDTSSRNYLKAIENAGVVPSVLQNAASNFLVTSEKAIGSYSLITAQYGFIGGNAATHKFNVNNPIDTDAGFRLAFVGTVNHSANGIQSSTGGYSNTFVNQNFNTNFNIAFGVYSTVNINNLSDFNFDMGVRNFDDNVKETSLSAKWSPNLGGNANLSIAFNPASAGVLAFDFTSRTTIGFFATSRIGTSFLYIAQNSLASSTNTVSETPIAKPFYIGRVNGGTGAFPSNRTYGYSFISQGLSSTQLTQQSRIVTFFNSMQNR